MTTLSGFHNYTYTPAEYDMLREATSSTPMFTLDGTCCVAKVVSVYDGDTMRVAMYLHDFSNGEPTTIRQFIVRMKGYDCPELRTRNTREKEFGYRSRDIFQRMVEGRIVYIECSEMDKYGRLLADVKGYSPTEGFIHLNQFMIDNHLGYSYLGDTKQSFDELLASGYYREEEIAVPELVDYPYKYVERSAEVQVVEVAVSSQRREGDELVQPVAIGETIQAPEAIQVATVETPPSKPTRCFAFKQVMERVKAKMTKKK